MATVTDKIYFILTEEFHKRNPKNLFGVVEITNYGYAALKHFQREYKGTSKYKILSIRFIPSNGIKHYTWMYGSSRDESGLFEIQLESGDVILLAVQRLFGRREYFEGFAIGTRSVVSGFSNIVSCYTKERAKNYDSEHLKPGYYKVAGGQGMLPQLIKQKRRAYNKIPIVHHVTAEIEQDKNNYFANLKEFKQYGQSGIRKILLVGPPGSGKSTYINKLIRDNIDDHVISAVTSISDLEYFVKIAVRSKYPAIAVLEDAETSLIDNSDVLNFLDGINQPKTKLGMYVVMTTNHPEKIAGRIINRPGRIDKFFFVGALEGKQAVECFNLYKPKSFKYDEEAMMPYFNNFTGAQLKELAIASKAVAAGRGEKLNADIVVETISIMKNGYKLVQKFAQDTTELMKTDNKVGFSNEEKQSSHSSWSFD